MATRPKRVVKKTPEAAGKAKAVAGDGAAKPAKARAKGKAPRRDGTAPPRGRGPLVIVESPTKAKTIGKYLGSGYEVKATVGHLRDLPTRELGVDVERGFEPKYGTIKGKSQTLAELK